MRTIPTNRILTIRNRRAFTLVEVIVAVALLALALGLLLVPIVNSLGYFRSATARADAQTTARLALDSVARELTEAMYVQLDMYDSSAIAFFPPLRVDPADPNSEVVTPPRPDWSQAIRYYRALYDPTINYNPGTHLGPGNTFFLGRSVIPAPFTYDDGWNRWNQAWATDMAGEQGVGNWAAIPRLVNMDLGLTFNSSGSFSGVGLRNATLQPGFPYLYVRRQLATGQIGQREAARLYRDYVVALTPSVTDYDVSELQFNPTVVAGEWLRPADSSGITDYSVYRARYPLWRLGAPYTGWAQLSDDTYVHQALQGLTWARDPFLLIYRYEPAGAGWAYTLRAIGIFDPRSRTMKIVDPGTQQAIYDSDSYPYRTGVDTPFAFGVDWVDGSLHCDFPPLGNANSMVNLQPMMLAGSDLAGPTSVGGTSTEVYQAPLANFWEARAQGADLSAFLDPDSIRVRADTNGDSIPDRTLTQVYSIPRDYLDEVQIGLTVPDNAPDDLKYGYLRLPTHLAGGIVPNACNYYIDFRWRNNGLVPATVDGRPGTLADEKPDLISAYYRTVAVMDISITVTKADLGATGTARVSQSAHLTRRVKLPNLLREIRYEQ